MRAYESSDLHGVINPLICSFHYTEFALFGKSLQFVLPSVSVNSSWCMWVNWPGADGMSEGQRFFGLGGGASAGFSIVIGYEQPGMLVYRAGGETYQLYQLPAGKWVHLCFVVYTQNNQFTLFVNGQQEAVVSSVAIGVSFTAFQSKSTTVFWQFNGMLSDFQVGRMHMQHSDFLFCHAVLGNGSSARGGFTSYVERACLAFAVHPLKMASLP